MATGERIWATIHANNYENSAPVFGLGAVAVVWLVSLTHATYKIAVPLGKYGPWYTVAYIFAPDESSDFYTRFITIALTVLDVCTSAADFVLILIHRMQMKNLMSDYSLSRSYQTAENLRVTQRLVLPMGLCNSFFFLICMGLINAGQVLQPYFDPKTFAAYYETVSLLFQVPPPLSLCILLLFTRRRKPTATVADASEQTRMYFDQFRKQLAG
ncbi:hypothetical protein AAVH_17258 [Aphelenchoides avenae]|nr:hypothetical protein AAVH_17258 [Aphelenchus avenae]